MTPPAILASGDVIKSANKNWWINMTGLRERRGEKWGWGMNNLNWSVGAKQHESQ